MTRARVEGFTISLDGYGAGPNQDINNPLGVGGTELHQWLVPTRTFQRALFGKDGGTTGVDDDFAARGFQNVGAWILGRNMFGPIRGDWPDTNWKGWWGDNPPYHVPVFILPHHARPPIEMEGDTTFHFITMIPWFVEGTMNVLKYHGIIVGPMGRTGRDTNIFIANSGHTVLATHGGFVEILVKLNEKVEVGQKVAIQRNTFGEVVAEYSSEVAGEVAGYRRDATAEPGTPLVFFFYNAMPKENPVDYAE